MVCRYCGKEIDSDAAFCSACGAATGQVPDKQIPHRQFSGGAYPYNSPTNPFAPPKKKAAYKSPWFWALIVIAVIIFAMLGSFLHIITNGINSVITDLSSAYTDVTSSDSETPSSDGKIGKYNVTVKDYRVADGSEGDKLLIVTYSFTNNGTEPESFSSAIDDNLFQNGVAINPVYLWHFDGYSDENQSKDILPGVTLDVQVAYKLNEPSGDVEIHLERRFSLGIDKLVYTITID